MARIRTIKPEFFTSADITALTPLSRLFYVSLWCESDREGRLKWCPKTLKIRYLPVDDCDIEALTQELISVGLIEIYTIDGKEYAEIPSFKHHQVINNRESDSIIPARVKDASARVKAEGRKEGKEGKGKEVASLTQEVPEFILSDVWEDWVQHRREIKEPLTARSIKMQFKELGEWKEKGHDPNQIIRHSIASGWKGLFEPKGVAQKPAADMTKEQQEAAFLKKVGYL